MSVMLDLKLCLVKNNFAWFTSCTLSLQDGEGWGDSPYEYCAGDPFIEHNLKDGSKQRHEVVKIYWEGPYVTPDILDNETKLSARSINRGSVPWLSMSPWSDQELKPIHSGATLKEFIDHIQAADGEVFIPSIKKLSTDASLPQPEEAPREFKKKKDKPKSKSKKKKSK